MRECYIGLEDFWGKMLVKRSGCLQNLHLGPSDAPAIKTANVGLSAFFFDKTRFFSNSCCYNDLLYKSFNRKDECVSVCVQP